MFYNDLNDSFKTHCIGTHLKFIFIPRRCYMSGKILFLKKAYEQVAMWTGPGDPVFEHRYYDKDEFIKARLKDLV